jgi:hypothetical protein
VSDAPTRPDDDRDHRGGQRFAGQHDDEPDVPVQPHPDSEGGDAG